MQRIPKDANRRRLLLRGGVVAGGVTAFAAGYGEVVFKAGKGLVTGSAGTVPAHATRGNALTPEFRIDPVTGVLSTQPGQVVSPSSCLGCWTQCGVRVRVDTASNDSAAQQQPAAGVVFRLAFGLALFVLLVVLAHGEILRMSGSAEARPPASI